MINSEGNPILERTSSKSYEEIEKGREDKILNGKMHDSLKKTDNIKILKEQIRKRAESENDPKVKESLMKRYEEL